MTKKRKASCRYRVRLVPRAKTAYGLSVYRGTLKGAREWVEGNFPQFKRYKEATIMQECTTSSGRRDRLVVECKRGRGGHGLRCETLRRRRSKKR